MVTERQRRKFWSHVDQASEGCWEWHAARTRKGYGQGWIGKRGLAHRLAWELTSGPIPDGLCVLHRCDNPPCVRPEHLFLGTQHENIADAVQKGRMASEKRRAKLTADAVRCLRAEYRGESPYGLARRYGVAPPTIYAILRGWHWRAVTGGVDIFQKQPRLLTPAVVAEIRQRHANGERARVLARAYGIGEGTMSRLLHRRIYRAE
jgi:Mor family transcriptional regulator